MITNILIFSVFHTQSRQWATYVSRFVCLFIFVIILSIFFIRLKKIFQDPQPFEPSNGIINLEFCRRGSMSWQTDMLFHKPIGTENCLQLSVYTHDIKPNVLKPVMVWIHGGAFIFGSVAKEYYNPELLLRKDIVFIAMNYRLGALGKLYFIINRNIDF